MMRREGDIYQGSMLVGAANRRGRSFRFSYFLKVSLYLNDILV